MNTATPANTVAPGLLRDASGSPRLMGYVGLFVLLMGGLFTAGALFHRRFEKDFKNTIAQQLAAIGDLKVRELVQFRRERLADAKVFFNNSTFAGLVQRAWASPPDTSAQADLQAWLTQFQANYEYNSVFLMDAQGMERLVIPADIPPVGAVLKPRVAEAQQSGKIVFQDLYRSARDGRIYLAILVPLHDPSGHALGVLGLRVDPTASLYPMLNRWPLAHHTAESKLVRKDGDAALYLNDLRTRKDTALNERVPLSESGRTAVMAVQGRTGFVEGVNQPGRPVVGYLLPVPDSPWYVVLRIESDEALAPVREHMWLTFWLVTTLVAALGAGLVLIWHTERNRYLRGQVAAADALRASEQHYRTLVEQMGEGVALVSPTEQLAFVNPTAAAIFGEPTERLEGRNLAEFATPEQLERRREQVAKCQMGQKISYSFEISRRDGSKRTLMVTATARFDQRGEYQGTFSIFRDVTQRRRVVEALRRSEALVQSVLRATADGLLAVSNDDRVLLANARFAELWRVPSDILARGDDTVVLRHVADQIADTQGFLRKVRELNGTDAESFDILHLRDGRVFDRRSRPLLEQGQVRGRVWSFRDVTAQRQADAERERLIEELRTTLGEVKTMSGLLPICASCKKIRDDQGYWNQVEVYVRTHTNAEFSHGLCPDCAKSYFPDVDFK